MRWRGIICLFLLAVLLLEVQGEVLITEIMYDFPGTDSKHEWLEVQNSGMDTVNLTLWKLREGGTNHGLSLVSGDFLLLSGEFVVIADDGKTFLMDYLEFAISNGTLLDTTFTSGLSNNGEKLELLNGSGQVVFSVLYNASLGGAGNNNTLCWHNSSWKECLATPGKANLAAPIAEKNNLPNASTSKNTSVIFAVLSPHLSNEVFVGKSYDDLFKITFENKKNCSGKNKIQMGYNITSNTLGVNYFVSGNRTKEVGCNSYADTGEFTPLIAGEYLLCGRIIGSINSTAGYSANPVCYTVKALDTTNVLCNVSLSIQLEDTASEDFWLYQQDQSIKFTPELNAENYPYIIEYWIEDLFGNMVKNKYNTTNTNQKSWKADIKEEDRVLWIKAKVYPFCKDVDLEDNSATQMLIVTNNGAAKGLAADGNVKNGGSESKENASSIEIIKISPSPAKYGETLKAEVEIYKGNTNKYLVSAWVEKDGKEISEKTKVNLYTKYSKYKLSLPIKLDDNCNLKEGKVKVMVEGLGNTDEETISVSIDEKQCGSEAKKTTSQKDFTNKETASKSNSATLSAELVDLASVVLPLEPMEVKVKFIGDENKHEVKVWSYIYRGSKCYSCGEKEREDNAKEVKINPSEEKEVLFWLNLDKALEEGEYKVKVKFVKDNQKTEHELTGDVYVKVPEEKLEVKETKSPLLSGAKANKSEIEVSSAKKTLMGNGFVAYESSTEKAGKVVPYFLIVAVILLGVVLLRKT